MPEEAQPAPEAVEPGQGSEGTGSDNLYADFLDGVPEDLHETLTERLKAKDGEFTKQQQKVSERWKPYEELGLHEQDPESVQGWLNLNGALEAALSGDPEATQQVSEWLNEVQGALGADEGPGSEYEGGEAEDLLDLSPDQLKEMISEQVQQAVSPVAEHLTQQEQEKALSEARSEIEGQLSKLRSENPKLTDEDQEDILALAYQFGQESEDPISAGFEKFKSLIARGESNLFEQKLDQPAPAESGGLPNTKAPTPTSENVQDLVRERLKQSMAT